MNLLKSSEEILSQLVFVTEHLSKEEFSRPLMSLNNSTVGQHLRHTIEFFQCLLRTPEKGILNYDKRLHNKLIESDSETAKEALNEIRTTLDTRQENFDMFLEGSYSEDGSDPYCVTTNFLRELAYNIEHAVHHMAIIKIGLSELKPAMELPGHFGIAVSTVRYKNAEAEKA